MSDLPLTTVALTKSIALGNMATTLAAVGADQRGAPRNGGDVEAACPGVTRGGVKGDNGMRRMLITLALAAPLLRAQAIPTQEQIDAALDIAVSTWGISVPVKVTLDAFGACPLIGHRDLAVTAFEGTDTTIKFDDGSGFDGGVAEEKSSSARYVIKINSRCDWNKSPLAATMLHEMGHVLIGGNYHSTDPKSIMYKDVHGYGQSITPADRAELSRRVTARSTQ